MSPVTSDIREYRKLLLLRCSDKPKHAKCRSGGDECRNGVVDACEVLVQILLPQGEVARAQGINENEADLLPLLYGHLLHLVFAF